MTTPTECGVCGRLSADPIPYCYRCADTLRAELLAVPGLVVDLDIAAGRLDQLSAPNEGGKSTETPLPIKLGRDGSPVDYARPLRALSETISKWAHVVADSGGLDFVAHRHADGLRVLVLNQRGGRSHRYDPAELLTQPIRSVEYLAVWLAHQPRELRASPDPVEMHDAVTGVIAYTRKLVDRLPERVLKGLCPFVHFDMRGERHECRTKLYAERGDEWVRCPKCRSLHDVRTLEAEALGSVEGQLFELRQILVLMTELGEPVPKSTLYAWANDARRKRLTPRAWKRFGTGQTVDVWIDRRDTPLYRLGDVRELRRRVERENEAAERKRLASEQKP